MVNNMKFQPPKGTKDFLQEEMVVREYVLDKIREIFGNYGFEPMETPAFEEFGLLSAKSGEDVAKQIFKFEDKGGRIMGLRFDLTVPLARVIASNPQLPKPFKRYSIGTVWRYEEPQAGRMRQFYQADIDICGSSSMEADAECISCAVDCLKSLGFEKFAVRINNRKILDGVLELVGVDDNKKLAVFRAIDKLDKIGEEGVSKELKKLNLSEQQIKKIFSIISIKGDFEENLAKGSKFLKGIKIAEEGIDELKEIYELSKSYGISDLFNLDYSLARGLDYYTGPIFEIVEETKSLVGTITAGGRYDNLIGQFGGVSTPATGISLGIERIVQLVRENNLISIPKTRIFIANVNDKTMPDAIKIVQKLRKENVSCQIDLMGRNLSKQLEYADAAGIPYVIVVGERELKTKKFKLRDMKNKSEKEVSLEEVARLA